MELSAICLRPVGMTTSIRRAILLAAAILVLVITACSPAGGGSGAPTTATDAARLALAQQARFAGIGPPDEGLIGQAAWYEVAESGDGWEVLIRIGWGDCPAGCINQHRWTYAIGRDGSVELAGEEGDTLPDATGVRGAVSAGPTCPVVTDRPDPDCADRPVAGAVLVFTDAAGAEVDRTTSLADGSFSIELAPGSYRLVPQEVDGLMGTAGPIDVEVEAGQPMAEVAVSYDTGIR